ncbi:MAG: hypothetical protein BROFUL_00445 [Candidatus Brocadia fulgida]|uniref:Uncharacterized protein n=1 Tax=Candidatus Brocadia fulgida TaxID=380242 RepID=A0A0M2UY97_9BACT|nr:MAG: hypothetical protein BROFUL_00445 [Candidatus Brocadia fulgida]
MLQTTIKSLGFEATDFIDHTNNNESGKGGLRRGRSDEKRKILRWNTILRRAKAPLRPPNRQVSVMMSSRGSSLQLEPHVH